MKLAKRNCHCKKQEQTFDLKRSWYHPRSHTCQVFSEFTKFYLRSNLGCEIELLLYMNYYRIDLHKRNVHGPTKLSVCAFVCFTLNGHECRHSQQQRQQHQQPTTTNKRVT